MPAKGIVAVSLLLICICGASPASAGDSYYIMHLFNDSDYGIDVKLTGSDCVAWQGTGKQPNEFMGPFTSMTLEFTRDGGGCHGHDGTFTVSLRMGIAPELTRMTVAFTADHALWLLPADSELVYSVLSSFQKNYKNDDRDLVEIHLYNPHRARLEDVLKGGCRSASELDRILQAAANSPGIGSIANDLIKSRYQPGSMVSRFEVASKVWGFRTTSRPDEIAQLLESRLFSYYNLERMKPDIAADFVARNGDYCWENKGVAMARRLLAIRNSRAPYSCFSSVALDFATAASFDTSGVGYVYAFQFVPLSPVFGLKSCDMKGGGELQFQPSSTNIQFLMRRLATGRGGWQLYSMGAWADSTMVPAN